MHRNVWILTIAQAFMMSMNSLNVFVGGLVGNQLAPSPKLATLPVASVVVGTALATIPVTFLMKKLGRRLTFLLIGIYSIFIAFLAGYAIHLREFYFFTLCTFLLGLTSATLMQFRFASMESVTPNQVPKAASIVLIGGIAAAFIGPEVAVFGKDLLETDFAGSYLMLSATFFIGVVTLFFYQNTSVQSIKSDHSQRSLRQIIKQPLFVVAVLSATVGYAVMTFIMTATPVSMHIIDGHSIEETKWVIQSHIMAMFVPSIFTGWLIEKLGITRIMIYGLFFYLICLAIGYSGHLVPHYWVSLILLGLGWNFLFVGGTALLPQAYSSAEKFKVQALNEFVVFGAQAIASLSAGWVVFQLGWEILLVSTIPVIGLHFMAIGYWKRRKSGI